MPEAKLPRVDIASVPDDLRERLWDQLEPFFPSADRRRIEQKSALPPAWVQILAELVDWTTPFKVAAGVYMAQLAKHLADDHWDRREEIRKKVLESCGAGIDRVRALFGVFNAAQEELGRRLGVIAAIPGPGDGETEVRLGADDEAGFVEQFCLFTANVEGIKAASERLGPDGVAWKVQCVLSADRFTLKWHDGKTMQPYERDFRLDGTPLGERRPWIQSAGLPAS